MFLAHLRKVTNGDKEKIFSVKRSEQKKTVDELIEESALTQSYYFMLVFSTIIVVAGILLQYETIIIAGMIIAPLLRPILACALGIATMKIRLIIRSLSILIISCALVIIISFGLFFTHPVAISTEIAGKLVFNNLIFLVSFFAGMAATLGWTKHEEMSELLSGVAIAVTILPPLAIMGIAFAQAEPVLLGLSGAVLLYNILAIIAGSVIIFALSGFTSTPVVRNEVDKQLDEEEKSE